uniref:SAM-dependent MTase RsmB/NOP-type domain-containing protein n=1 Tax=Sundstroemia setigera TaxID=3005 RepID=A0A7S0A165_9STRA|mmetsp:Transcript_237/g.297  ORF Transcript_237/g.297 Transcript_237/m.297 type:complete len:393 (+) Transcript_237:1-1179(+)
MRIRHFFTLLSILENCSGTVILETYGGDLCIEDIEPINGVEEHDNHELKKITSSYGETHDTLLTNRLKVVRAMVDIHFDYMMNDNSQDDLQPLLLKYITSNKRPTKTKIDDQEQRIISITQSLPLFFVKLMMEQYGQTLTREITSTFNKPGPITLRLNKIKCDTQDRLRDRLWKDDNITTTDSTNICIYKKNKEAQQKNFSHLTKQQQQHQILQLIPVNNNNNNENNIIDSDGSSSSQQKSIWSLDAWKDGWFEVQDAGSQLIVDACEINGDEEIIVDYCAGNGGKTFGLASQLYDMKKKKQQQQQQKQQDSAEGVGRESERSISHIIAHDVVHDRLRQIEGSFDRIGIHKHNNSDAEETIKITTITTSIDNNNNNNNNNLLFGCWLWDKRV